MALAVYRERKAINQINIDMHTLVKKIIYQHRTTTFCTTFRNTSHVHQKETREKNVQELI